MWNQCFGPPTSRVVHMDWAVALLVFIRERFPYIYLEMPVAQLGASPHAKHEVYNGAMAPPLKP